MLKILRVYLSENQFQSGSATSEVVGSAPPGTGVLGDTHGEKAEAKQERFWLAIA